MFNNDKPIYIQLMDKIRELIVKEEYQSGKRLPSVREYASLYELNPNTVQKALTELEKEKLIVTDSTNGRYVTTDIKLIKETKDYLAKEKTKEYIASMNNIGITKEEINKYIGGIK